MNRRKKIAAKKHHDKKRRDKEDKGVQEIGQKRKSRFIGGLFLFLVGILIIIGGFQGYEDVKEAEDRVRRDPDRRVDEEAVRRDQIFYGIMVISGLGAVVYGLYRMTW